MAGRIKECLSGLGMDVFLAHEDLEPSREWQKEILKELSECDVFIPILTNHFRSSLWVDQETGIAVGRKKCILPLKLGTDPYGFIGKVQALKFRDDLEDVCSRIVCTLASNAALSGKTKDGVIKTFLESRSFKESEKLGGILLELKPFSRAQVNYILIGAAENLQIYNGFAAQRAIRELIATNQPRPRKDLAQRFERQVQSGTPFIPQARSSVTRSRRQRRRH